MASGLDQAAIDDVLDGSNLAGSGYATPWTGINLRQMTASGSSTAAGTELGTTGG